MPAEGMAIASGGNAGMRRCLGRPRRRHQGHRDRLGRGDQVADGGAVGGLRPAAPPRPAGRPRPARPAPAAAQREVASGCASEPPRRMQALPLLMRERRRLDRHVRPALVDHARRRRAAPACGRRGCRSGCSRRLADGADRVGHRGDSLATARRPSPGSPRRRASGGRGNGAARPAARAASRSCAIRRGRAPVPDGAQAPRQPQQGGVARRHRRGGEAAARGSREHAHVSDGGLQVGGVMGRLFQSRTGPTATELASRSRATSRARGDQHAALSRHFRSRGRASCCRRRRGLRR